jgi:hypothetical protein
MALIGTINSGNNLNFKNKLINGNFDFWQRNTSGTPAVIWAYVSADRWGGHHDGTAGTYSRSTNVPDSASTYSMRMTGTSGGGAAYLDQRVEASEMREIIAKGAVTVSGWIRRVGSPTAALSLGLICPTAADNYSSYTTHGSVFTVNNTITGNGSASGSAITLTDNDTWYYFTMTDTSIASRTNIANGAQFYFAVGGLNANTKYFEFSRIQVEAGSVATPFEFRPPSVELALCQRYYEKSYSLDVNPGTNSLPGLTYASTGSNLVPSNYGFMTMVFKVTKRSIPAMVIYSPGGTANRVGDGDQSTYSVVGTQAVGVRSAIVQNGGGTMAPSAGMTCGHFTADSEI